MSDILMALTLVNEFFYGDWGKTLDWFTNKNVLLGGAKPVQMVDVTGACPKLLKFIKNSLEENKKDE